MPAAFEKCVKNGGEVRRMSGPSKRFGLKAGQYINICYSGGKTYIGEKHTKGEK